LKVVTDIEVSGEFVIHYGILTDNLRIIFNQLAIDPLKTETNKAIQFYET